MRILAVTNMYPSAAFPGRGVFVREQIKGLRAVGLDVEVLVVNRREEGPLAYYRMEQLLRRSLADFLPDVVHAMYGGVMADQVARHRSGLPFAVTFHGSDLLGENLSGWLRRIVSRYGVSCSRRAARSADGVVVVARHLMSALHGAAPPEKVRVIPCGIDLDRFRPLDSEQCKNDLGWRTDRFHVVFASTNGDPVKRPWLAEAAVARIPGAGPPPELHYLAGIRNMDVPVWLNAGDALLLTSQHEGSPTVVKEALACGLPVVSVRVGDIAERIAGITGCFLARAEPGDLATKLCLIRARRRRLDSAAADRVRSLSLPTVGRALARFYAEIAAGCRRLPSARSASAR